jgi:beta-lactamase regulating signal transducer with metallopeptidase domain
MTPIIDSLALVDIASSAARSMLLGGIAACALAAFRVRETSARLFTWKAVLYIALGMFFLMRAFPGISVPVPSLLRPAKTESAATQLSSTPAAIVETPRPTHISTLRNVPTSRSLPRRTATATNGRAPSSTEPVTLSLVNTQSASVESSIGPMDWRLIVVSVYAIVALALLLRFAIGIVWSRKLIAAAEPIDDSWLKQALTSAARNGQSVVVPQIAESRFISVPVTIGALRSTILLPSGWQEWDEATLQAVITHEMSHVARRDALTQRISLIHRAIFWFSPFAWWLDRQLAVLAEEASDEAALACGTDRNKYARTLLGFFEALHAAPGRIWWQGVAMAKAGQAEQRLERILAWKGTVRMGLKKSIAVMVIALGLPVVYLTAAVRPSMEQDIRAQQNSNDRTPPLAPSPQAAPSPSAEQESTPAPAVAPTAPFARIPAPGRPAIAPTSPTHPFAAMRPMVPMVPMAPMAPVKTAIPAVPAFPQMKSHGDGFSYAYGMDDEDRFVIVSGKSDSFTMSGSSQDAHHVERLKKEIKGDFIWFQRDEKSYIIRDQATIDRARKLWAPQEELGKKQEELGKQQEVLGEQQEKLGEKMEQVKVNLPDLSSELDKLKAKLQKLGPSATMDQIGDLQSEIGDLQSKIGDIQSAAGEQQGKLGEEQGALGEKQGKLGEEQGKLGEQQAELARKANIEMKGILDQAIKDGKAQPEGTGGGSPTL